MCPCVRVSVWGPKLSIWISICVCVWGPKLLTKMCQTSNTQIFVLLTIYVENKYGKKACNHTNATNSPLSHIHNYKKKACNHNNPTNSPQSRTERQHFCRAPTITKIQQIAHNNVRKEKPAITPMQQTAHNHILTQISKSVSVCESVCLCV